MSCANATTARLALRITLILITSPSPSMPSTELVDAVLESLPSALCRATLIIYFDGLRIQETHQKQKLKKGRVSLELAAQYPEYIANVKQILGCKSEPPTIQESLQISHGRTKGGREVVFLESLIHRGFAYGIKAAMDYCTTSQILVLQHDWVFNVSLPFDVLSDILNDEPDVQYITFIARNSVHYLSSRGSFDKKYRAVHQRASEDRKARPLAGSIIPCFHIFDRPHLCDITFYEKIFNVGMIRHGDFVEDTIGTKYGESIKLTTSMTDAFVAWKFFSAWIYAPNNGSIIAVRHTSGRVRLNQEAQAERIRKYVQNNLDRSQNPKSDSRQDGLGGKYLTGSQNNLSSGHQSPRRTMISGVRQVPGG